MTLSDTITMPRVTPAEYLTREEQAAEKSEYEDGAGHHRQCRGFPGLWLDIPALLRDDRARVLATLQRGITTTTHAAPGAGDSAR